MVLKYKFNFANSTLWLNASSTNKTLTVNPQLSDALKMSSVTVMRAGQKQYPRWKLDWVCESKKFRFKQVNICLATSHSKRLLMHFYCFLTVRNRIFEIKIQEFFIFLFPTFSSTFRWWCQPVRQDLKS